MRALIVLVVGVFTVALLSSCSSNLLVNGQNTTTSIRTVACTGLISNASWNSASSITQSLTDGSWLPSELGSFSLTASETECRYKCNSGYTHASSKCYVSGQLDPDFGTAGRVINLGRTATPGTTFGGVALASDGSFYTVGFGNGPSGTEDLFLWKYDPSGTLSTTFNGGQGYVTHHGAAGGSTSEYAYALKIDSEGRIVAVGTGKDASNNDKMVLWRFLPSGALDTSFNGVGYLSKGATMGGTHDFGAKLAIDSSGRILVSGKSNGKPIVWRYTSSGALDTTFNGGNGYFAGSTGLFAGGGANFWAIDLDANGKIVLGGFDVDATQSTAEGILYRLNSDGTLDTSFAGGTGYVHASQGATYWVRFYTIKIATDGSIFIGADRTTTDGSAYPAAVYKYTSAGMLDTTFNGKGYYEDNTHVGESFSASVNGVEVDSSGRVMLVGASDGGGTGSAGFVLRLKSDGTLDTSFGSGGALLYRDPAGQDSSYPWTSLGGIIIDSEGRILVAGETSTSAGNYAGLLYRFIQ